MKYAQIGEDVRREHRDPADQSEGSSESRLFAPNWVSPSSSLQPATICLNLVCSFVRVHLRNKYAAFTRTRAQARAVPIMAAHARVYIKMQRKS